MKKILIGILTLVLIFSLVLGARKLFFKKDDTEMLLAEQMEEVEEESEEDLKKLQTVDLRLNPSFLVPKLKK